jgi:hypothetical protein
MEAIYARAVQATGEGDLSVLDLSEFQKELLGMRISFGEAQTLDHTYFGFMGEYWLSAYNYPCIGDCLPMGVVTHIGLLTFLTDE